MKVLKLFVIALIALTTVACGNKGDDNAQASILFDKFEEEGLNDKEWEKVLGIYETYAPDLIEIYNKANSEEELDKALTEFGGTNGDVFMLMGMMDGRIEEMPETLQPKATELSESVFQAWLAAVKRFSAASEGDEIFTDDSEADETDIFSSYEQEDEGNTTDYASDEYEDYD